jgi:hypothetical protein
MSDDLPTEEQLRRIERGVQRRIDARRATTQQVVRRVAGGIAAVLLIGGGFALLRPLGVGTATSSSSGGSAARPSSTEIVAVRCHDGRTTTEVRVARTGLPAAAVQACAAAAFTAGAQPDTASGTSATPTPTPRPSALCRAEDGALHVYVGAAAVCAAHGMTAYRG